MSDKLGVTVKSIQRYEKGHRLDTYVLVRLATYFNVSTDYLLGLKNYEEFIKERKEKLKYRVGYKDLYSNYLRCLNDYEIIEGAVYYWIELDNGHMGGQTAWAGWYNEESTLEIRELRPVKPKEAIEFCTKVNGKPMVLNSETDAMIFLIYGGQAIVRKDICEKYLPGFMRDYIGPNPERKILEEYKKVLVKSI